MISRLDAKKFLRATNRDLSRAIVCGVCQLSDSNNSKVFYDNTNDEYICEKCLDDEKYFIDEIRKYLELEDRINRD